MKERISLPFSRVVHGPRAPPLPRESSGRRQQRSRFVRPARGRLSALLRKPKSNAPPSQPVCAHFLGARFCPGAGWSLGQRCQPRVSRLWPTNYSPRDGGSNALCMLSFFSLRIFLCVSFRLFTPASSVWVASFFPALEYLKRTSSRVWGYVV